MNEDEETDCDIDILFGALKAARKAFDEYIEKKDLDPAFWKLAPLEGWVLSQSFEKMDRIVLDDSWRYDDKEGE